MKIRSAYLCNLCGNCEPAFRNTRILHKGMTIDVCTKHRDADLPYIIRFAENQRNERIIALRARREWKS